MKKIIVCFAAAVLLAGAAFAQSLADNSYYRRSLELQTQAEQAFDEGNYDASADYSAQAQENARLSDEYVAKMIDMRSARDSINSAQARYDSAAKLNAAKRYPEKFTDATTELDQAKLSFAEEYYAEAKMHAELVLSLLSGFQDTQALPSAYMVREKATLTDCLWRIAAMPFVYNDPWQWTKLYQANRTKLPEPGNPDLILPGMVLSIPPLAGEYREGAWTAGIVYPVFKK
ncbi:MAG: hypothetical protein E4H20_02440 [Spirochaetales bacterium]|nr:MAG: hypothetical protein E4H20_02440 [Spirochaetales bacterium]